MIASANPVLFPTDFQPHSDAAFEYAACFAAANASKLVVLHVCNMPDMAWDSGDEQSHHDALKQQLESICTTGVDMEHIFTVADPGPEICRVAGDLDCGMIVMGKMHKLGPDALSSGTVHGFVEKHATCPLVTLRQPLE